MIAAVKAGSYSPPDAKRVQALANNMKANPPKDLGPLVGYQDPGKILLEDGHNRLTAAGMVDFIPMTVTMYVGVSTPASP